MLWKIGNARKQKIVFLSLAIGLVATLVVSLVSLIWMSAFLVSTVQSQSNSAFVTNEATGLRLTLSINTTSLSRGRTIDIQLDAQNTLPTPNTVNGSSIYRIKGLSAGPCGGLGTFPSPMGFALFSGYHTADNLWYGQLGFYSPGPYFCPLFRSPMKWYVFAANGDNATGYGPCNGGPCFTEPMRLDRSLSGYWIISPVLNSGAFTTFSPGVYTIVGGDEWGDLVLLHFAVT